MRQPEAKEPKTRQFGELEVVRWFCYLGFMACSVLLVAGLALGWDWRAPLVGSIVWGVPSLIMYQREQNRREAVEAQRVALDKRHRAAGDRFSDPSDPTQPPTREINR